MFIPFFYQMAKRLFFALWHRWHNLAVLTHFLKLFTVIYSYGLSAAGTYIFWSFKNNKQTAKRIAAKSVKTVTVTDESNHLSSSSNSLHLSLSLCVFTSPISPPSVSLSTCPHVYLLNLCVLVVCAAYACMHVRFCDCESAGACGSCCLLAPVLWSSRGRRQTRTFWAGVLHLYLYLQTGNWKQK